MKSAVLALSPRLAEEPSRLEELGARIRALRELGTLTHLHAAAVVHPDLYSYPLTFFHSAKADLCKRAHDDLSKAMLPHLPVSKLTVFARVTSDHEALAETLSAFTQRRRASVLVIGSAGARGFLSRSLLGDLAENVLNHAEVPVLIVPGGPPRASGPARTIVFAVAMSHFPSARTLRHLARAARLTSSSVRVLHVRPPRTTLRKLLRNRRNEGASELELTKISRFLEERGVKTYCETVEANNTIAETIEAFSAQHHASMVAIHSPGRNRLRGLFLESTGEALLRHCTRPLYVLRPD